MKCNISLKELEKVSYLDYSKLEGRPAPLLPFLNDEGEWENWRPRLDKLVRIMGGEPVESDYFAREPERSTDLYLEFMDFITKHAYFPDIAFFIDGIRSDIHNLGASLNKIDYFYNLSSTTAGTSRFVATETEYIFFVCRSMFDLLQEVIVRLWARAKISDPNIRKGTLRKSFNDLTKLDMKSIQKKYGLPEVLADFYIRKASFFQILKSYRDEIIHSGKSFELIYPTKKGFAVHKDTNPFARLNIWKEEDLLPNGLAPLRLAIAFIINETLNSCDDFAEAIKGSIKFPPDIAPGYKLFIRGFHSHKLLEINNILDGNPWRD